ncbi:MAG: MFS transporter [Limisphaerales bacterium]
MSDKNTITYRYEMMRAVAQGILETAAHAFLLIIAVKWFEAGSVAKALVAAAGSFGLLLSPVIVSKVEHIGCRTSKAAACILGIGAISLVVMAVFPILPVFVIGSILAMASSSGSIPLMTQVYQENYPKKQRGRRFSRTVMVKIVAAVAFGHFAGKMLDADIERSRWMLLIFAGAFAFSSFCVSRIPSTPLHVSGGTHPLRALRFAKTDTLFRLTLIAWMFMGFGNLMMFPIRVDYLANENLLNFDVLKVAVLAVVIPNTARLLTSPLWGWLFDHMNFFVLRALLNVGFGLGIGVYFNSDSMVGLTIGAILFGISHSGGDVAWSLWVTKFAPPERVADYMSTHTFFTGVRGALGPIIGFALIGYMGGSPEAVSNVAWISIAFITVSVFLLVKEIPAGRHGRDESALNEDVSE